MVIHVQVQVTQTAYRAHATPRRICALVLLMALLAPQLISAQEERVRLPMVKQFKLVSQRLAKHARLQTCARVAFVLTVFV